jgi:hypothetical protein
MQRVRDEKLPVGVNNDLSHCLTAGLIARYCSRQNSAGRDQRNSQRFRQAEDDALGSPLNLFHTRAAPPMPS